MFVFEARHPCTNSRDCSNYKDQIEKFMSFADVILGAVAVHVPFYPQAYSASCVDNIDVGFVEFSAMYFDSSMTEAEQKSIITSIENLRVETSGLMVKYGWADEKVAIPSDASAELYVLAMLAEGFEDAPKDVVATFEEKVQQMIDKFKPQQVEKLHFKPAEAPMTQA